MAEIPKKTTTVDLIYKHYEDQQQDNGWREHLGASQIGKPCYRQLWYQFRWCVPFNHPGRLLRLFRRGELEEKVLTGDLRAIGVTVHEVDPQSGKQYRFADCGGHVGGSCDGVALGIKEAPKTWHIVEYKTCNDKSFKALCKNGVEGEKPEHFAQMQLYMGWAELTRALYLAVNKNDDSIYQERIKFDKAVFKALCDKAREIVFSEEPLHKFKTDSSFVPCVYCDYKQQCHYNKAPAVNCRTCTHSTPLPEGGWHCTVHGCMLDKQKQIEACEHHLFNPHLLAGDVIEVDQSTPPQWAKYQYGDVTYFNLSQMADASLFVNGYYSGELPNLDAGLLGDANIEQFRKTMGARVK